jgi:ABC-type transporter Mla maintaining outer membrane lipid asymmetry permease subunit MlaE
MKSASRNGSLGGGPSLPTDGGIIRLSARLKSLGEMNLDVKSLIVLPRAVVAFVVAVLIISLANWRTFSPH